MFLLFGVFFLDMTDELEGCGKKQLCVFENISALVWRN